jgi:integrase
MVVSGSNSVTWAKDGKTYARSANTVYSCLQSLSSLWNRWLVEELAIVVKNPFAKITLPKLDKPTVRYASDEQMAHFFDWLDCRFEGWELPDLFFTIKTYTGCRLFDLCSLRSNQLQDNGIFFPANMQKGRKDRRVPLSKDLYDRLTTMKGDTFLWERYPAELKAICQRKGWQFHQLRLDFDPARMLQWIETLMFNYRTENPDQPRLTTHMLRKRAMTQSWQAHIDPRKAAIAFGVAVDTMMKHYVQLDEQATTDEVFNQLHGLE